MSWDEIGFTCPICNTDAYVPPAGNPDSPAMIIGEHPGTEEIKDGIPMVGAMGNVLKTELRLLGLDLNMFRIANLWFHPPHKRDHPLYNDCLSHGVEQLIKEAKTKKAILLLGSETGTYFCNKSVLSVCGLQVKSVYLSAPIIYACVNPATVFHGGIGEVRLAIQKFIQRIEAENIL